MKPLVRPMTISVAELARVRYEAYVKTYNEGAKPWDEVQPLGQRPWMNEAEKLLRAIKANRSGE